MKRNSLVLAVASLICLGSNQAHGFKYDISNEDLSLKKQRTNLECLAQESGKKLAQLFHEVKSISGKVVDKTLEHKKKVIAGTLIVILAAYYGPDIIKSMFGAELPNVIDNPVCPKDPMVNCIQECMDKGLFSSSKDCALSCLASGKPELAQYVGEATQAVGPTMPVGPWTKSGHFLNEVVNEVAKVVGPTIPVGPWTESGHFVNEEILKNLVQTLTPIEGASITNAIGWGLSYLASFVIG